MKKLTTALILILCLVLIAFAFASCDKKSKGAKATTAKGGATQCAHEWGDYVVDLEPSCTDPGVKSKYCTICGAQDPESIAEVPMIDHVPGTEYKVDTPATCSAFGYESIHCVVCGQPVAETVRKLPIDANAHEVTEWTVTVEPTPTAIGERQGTCTLCKQLQTEAYALPIYNSKALAGPYASGGNVIFSKTVGEISGADKTFHPSEGNPSGNDLWLEYSFLWNDTLLDWNQTKAEMNLMGFKNPSNKYRHFYYLYTRDKTDSFFTSNDCPFGGHFDYSTYLNGFSEGHEWECAVDPGNGQPRYKAGWDSPISRSSSPYIYDGEKQTTGGWHRIGIRYHQEASNDPSKDGIVYTGYSELYVDGVKVWKILLDLQGYWDSTASEWKHADGYKSVGGVADLKSNDLLLWEAKTELASEDNPDEWTNYNGLFYKDHDDMIVYGSLEGFSKSASAIYVSFYDMQFTCGKNFVRNNVSPIATPAERTITLDDKGTAETDDDVTTSGAIFYEVN